ncbi:MAG: nucleotidyltransferase domain-containing protein [Bacteroidales bacterium]|nr:nucleotidyltransferase domain-containing protein [Bacteroidales bacterium]
MLNNVIKSNLPRIIEILRNHKVKSAYVFGSATTGNFNNNSDVDILVCLQEGLDPIEAGGYLWDLEEKLSELFNRDVDLLSERALKNPYLIKEITDTKVQIYG